MIELKLISKDSVEAKLNGYKFNMPLCNIPGTDKYIIAFDSMGKQNTIVEIAQELANRCSSKGADIIICPEAKAIPIAQELGHILGIDYFVLRKAKKLYMSKPDSIVVNSITTKGAQHLWYDEKEVLENLKGKKAILFDDVVSTGSSYAALELFANLYDINVVSNLTVFVEGDSLRRSDINHLGRLPILSSTDVDCLIGDSIKF